jgi:DNA-binding CsgD family transcriptional regulator
LINQSPIQVSIVGGNPIDRAALTLLLATFPGIEVITNDSSCSPSIIIWDSGSDLSHIPEIPKGASLFVLTNQVEIAAFPPGVAGLFSKEENPDALAAAIRQVARGQHYLSPSLAISMLRSVGQPKNVETKTLSEREWEIFDLLAQGLSNKAIAARLYLSVRTVEGHLDKIYSHLGVHSRTEAVILAMQQFQDR